MPPDTAFGGAHHVAQFNWGILVDDWDTPAIAGFQDNLAQVSAIAQRSEGFVWQMSTEDMEAEQLDPNGVLGGNPRLASTLSVWKSGKALETFVHNTVHGTFMKQRDKWFTKQESRTYVIWPIQAGRVPTLKEAADRLKMLGVKGPTKMAFDFNWLRENAQSVE